MEMVKAWPPPSAGTRSPPPSSTPPTGRPSSPGSGSTGHRHPRRVRFDWLPSIQSGRLIIPDYKTATDASDDAMQKDIAKYGYNQQADWYEDRLPRPRTRRPDSRTPVLIARRRSRRTW
jgi:hypothetical protein